MRTPAWARRSSRSWIGDGLASIAHVGDSRLYVRNASGFEALTIDHSLVEAQVQAGLINREQSLKSEHQNILLRALGRDPDTLVELGETTIAAGDRLLLCTDGLTKTVSDDGLAAALDRFRGDPQGACDHLIATANDSGGPDNITAVIVEVEDPADRARKRGRQTWHVGCSLGRRACPDLLAAHRALAPARAPRRPMK